MCIVNKIKECKENNPSKNKVLLIIVGKESYSVGSGGFNIGTTNLPFYKSYGFNNVAFLTDGETLDVYSIIALLCQSHDQARKIHNGSVEMERFAMYLYSERNLILVNEDECCKDSLKYEGCNNLEALLKDFPKHKVLFVGERKTRYKFLDENSYMVVPHCSGQTYATKPKDCCQVYFKFSYAKESDKNVSLNDFKVI